LKDYFGHSNNDDALLFISSFTLYAENYIVVFSIINKNFNFLSTLWFNEKDMLYHITLAFAIIDTKLYIISSSSLKLLAN